MSDRICPDCGGTGKKISPSGEEEVCPKCQGKGYREPRADGPQIKCPNCGYVGKSGQIGWDTGGCLITIILLICFIIPGIIYLIWRNSKSEQICCPKCKYLNVIRI